MDKKLKGLLEKEVLTLKEYEHIEEHEDVKEIENNGSSGRFIDKTWYTVYLQDGKEYDIYLSR